MEWHLKNAVTGRIDVPISVTRIQVSETTTVASASINSTNELSVEQHHCPKLCAIFRQ